MERNREMELRHGEELDRVCKEKDDLVEQIRFDYEKGRSAMEHVHKAEVVEMVRRMGIEEGLKREEERGRYERSLNDLKEECNDQVQVRKEGRGEPRSELAVPSLSYPAMRYERLKTRYLRSSCS